MRPKSAAAAATAAALERRGPNAPPKREMAERRIDYDRRTDYGAPALCGQLERP